ncbi:hypothetical protein WJX73_005299 [Symbiochloris irregularis]|uniref:3-oxoacyl-[acyl-carrier-protein] reductase n=1 Tax=Symbiochloris irregularis TaxID=706552 RepID=A0AAW1NU45_9CHLO
MGPKPGSRTVLITGGSSGIGVDLVKGFAALGDKVWFTYNSGKQRADEVLSSLPNGSNAEAFQYDMGSWESVQGLLQKLPSTPDIFVANAGLGTATVEEYVQGHHLQSQALMQANAVGPLWLTEGLLPGMKSRGSGNILFVASVGGGITVFPGMRLADGMSKAAVACLARQLAAETTHSGITVCCICPGATDTNMFQASSLNHLSPEERAAFIAGLPQGRLIPPREIAEQCIFLCSDAARSLHGAVIDASAGAGVRPGLVDKNH